MKTYSFSITHRAGFPTDFSTKANSLEEALVNILKECIEEDNTGYFFELECADVDALEKEDNFYKVSYDGYEYGTIVNNIVTA